MLARTVASQLLKYHPDWTREQVADYLRGTFKQAPDESQRNLIDQVLARWPDPGSRSPSDTNSDTATADANSSSIATAPDPFDWRSPSAWILICANLFPLYGVFVLGWSVYPLLLLYWIENVIIGMSTVLRMLTADPDDVAAWAGKLFLVPFFCFHFGMFTLVHGALLNGFFGPATHAHGMPLAIAAQFANARQAMATFHLGWQVFLIALSHALSFTLNYIGRGEYRRASLPALMGAPYGRVMIMHAVVLFGGLVVQAFHSPAWALVILIGLKMGLDLRAHLRERSRMARPPALP
jgi:hypothetical protein